MNIKTLKTELKGTNDFIKFNFKNIYFLSIDETN